MAKGAQKKKPGFLRKTVRKALGKTGKAVVKAVKATRPSTLKTILGCLEGAPSQPHPELKKFLDKQLAGIRSGRGANFIRSNYSRLSKILKEQMHYLSLRGDRRGVQALSELHTKIMAAAGRRVPGGLRLSPASVAADDVLKALSFLRAGSKRVAGKEIASIAGLRGLAPSVKAALQVELARRGILSSIARPAAALRTNITSLARIWEKSSRTAERNAVPALNKVLRGVKPTAKEATVLKQALKDPSRSDTTGLTYEHVKAWKTYRPAYERESLAAEQAAAKARASRIRKATPLRKRAWARLKRYKRGTGRALRKTGRWLKERNWRKTGKTLLKVGVAAAAIYGVWKLYSWWTMERKLAISYARGKKRYEIKLARILGVSGRIVLSDRAYKVFASEKGPAIMFSLFPLSKKGAAPTRKSQMQAALEKQSYTRGININTDRRMVKKFLEDVARTCRNVPISKIPAKIEEKRDEWRLDGYLLSRRDIKIDEFCNELELSKADRRFLKINRYKLNIFEYIYTGVKTGILPRSRVKRLIRRLIQLAGSKVLLRPEAFNRKWIALFKRYSLPFVMPRGSFLDVLDQHAAFYGPPAGGRAYPRIFERAVRLASRKPEVLKRFNAFALKGGECLLFSTAQGNSFVDSVADGTLTADEARRRFLVARANNLLAHKPPIIAKPKLLRFAVEKGLDSWIKSATAYGRSNVPDLVKLLKTLYDVPMYRNMSPKRLKAALNTSTVLRYLITVGCYSRRKVRVRKSGELHQGPRDVRPRFGGKGSALLVRGAAKTGMRPYSYSAFRSLLVSYLSPRSLLWSAETLGKSTNVLKAPLARLLARHGSDQNKAREWLIKAAMDEIVFGVGAVPAGMAVVGKRIYLPRSDLTPLLKFLKGVIGR